MVCILVESYLNRWTGRGVVEINVKDREVRGQLGQDQRVKMLKVFSNMVITRQLQGVLEIRVKKKCMAEMVVAVEEKRAYEKMVQRNVSEEIKMRKN